MTCFHRLRLHRLERDQLGSSIALYSYEKLKHHRFSGWSCLQEHLLIKIEHQIILQFLFPFVCDLLYI